eukprot:ANDGO_02636.mRNA.1 putative inactive dual specificity protein phosphatase-like At4g18593
MSTTNSNSYACRKCRSVLFSDDNILIHDKPAEGAASAAFGYYKGRKTLRSGIETRCMSLFLTPESVESLPWISSIPEISQLEGKLACPKCASKIGDWHWSGAQCSCGAWINPGFQVQRSRIDVVPGALGSQNKPS